MKRTVTIDLLKTIIENYPILPSYLVHKAGRDFCLSGSQRLRQLKKEYGILYKYKEHKYDFQMTPPLILHGILKELEG